MNGAEREAREAELAAARGGKTTLCERIESFYGDDTLDQIEQARSEWEGLAADPDEAIHAGFARRFQEACDRARDRHENRQDMARTNARLEELAVEAEQLAAQEDSPAYAWDSVSREWKSLSEKSEGLDATRSSSATPRRKRRSASAPRRRRRRPKRRCASRSRASIS